MFQTVIISFREGLEAFLIVAITLTYLRQTNGHALIPSVYRGIVVALVGCATLGIVMARIGSISPLWEGILALVAAILVISCTVHMLRMGKNMKGHIAAALGRANLEPSHVARFAVFGFVILMIGREGIEAATMIASLAHQTGDLPLAAGGVLGLILAGTVAWAWARYGNRVNLSRFFQVTAAFMIVFSLQLVIYAFHEFTESAQLASLGIGDIAYWHAVTEPYGPEGEIGAWISYSLVLVPVAFLLYGILGDRLRGAPGAG